MLDEPITEVDKNQSSGNYKPITDESASVEEIIEDLDDGEDTVRGSQMGDRNYRAAEEHTVS